MNSSPTTEPPRSDRWGLNPWLQRFLTIIAGTVVAVIAWTVLEAFHHILILLIASFIIAYLLSPLVDVLEARKLPRILAILLIYLVIIGLLAVGAGLLVGPLTAQLQGLTDSLPQLVNSQTEAPFGLDQFLKGLGINISFTDLRNEVVNYLSSAGSELLSGTLGVLTGLVTFVTDLLLVLVITFYLLQDGRNMRNSILRLVPDKARSRWFFIEAAVNRVLGGYIRGQIIVAATVGVAAGVGSGLLGVNYPLVIGLLAFLFEFVPMLGPVLGMIPAVAIALFQPMPLVWWVIVYFIVLQQVESNLIVPRVSGHAVGLHPLGALLALLAGFELGGIGGALLAVPLAGVLYLIGMALYSDATGQSELLVTQPRRTALQQITRRSPVLAPANPEPPAPIQDERLTTIAHEQQQLNAEFNAQQAAQQATQPPRSDGETPPLVAPPKDGV